MGHSMGMKPLEIDPTHVTSVQSLAPEPTPFVADNPLPDSAASGAFATLSGQLAERLNECATRIATHASEVAAFAEIVTRADENFSRELS